MADAQIGRPIATNPTSPGASGSPAFAHRAPPRAESRPAAQPSAIASAERPARRFFNSYLSFLYGRIPASSVANVDEQLRARLRSGLAFVTPAERTARPRIVRVALTPAGPPLSAIATAAVLAGGGRYRLTATLEPRGDTWIVVALDG